MSGIVAFATRPLPDIADVGGKGLSLLRMAEAKLAVPPAIVLTTGFFEPWLAELQATDEWPRFTAAGAAKLPELTAACDALKRRTSDLHLSAAQRDQVLAALDLLGAGTFAVRSSSPEEDLAEASFAGGYETVLGVTRATLEPAIRRAFTSCLDARVAAYKREHGFDPKSPRIAIVVQRQIASEVAGVGLSIDPITNSYDSAVFNASWGLGESVVSGRVTPDQFVVDKVTRRVIARRAGAKETAIWLEPDGGTTERPDPRAGELTLTDAQLLELSEQLVRVEALYGRPMDIEWAYAGGELFLLQARPMTAFVDLPDDLRTKPGAPKRLYFDVTLAVQGFSKPMSVAGTSVLAEIARTVSRYVTGKDVTGDLDVSLGVARHGRLYANLSRVLALVGKKRLVRAAGALDPTTGEAVSAVDEAAYARGSRPSLRALLHVPRLALRLVRAALWPAAYRARVDARVAAFLEAFPELARADLALPALARHLLLRTIAVVLHIVPAVAMWIISMNRIRRMFPSPDEEHARLLRAIDQSLPGNVTVQMGLELANLPEDAASDAWKTFLERYGHRGPGELDVAAPRYRESPKLLLDQVRQLAKGAQDPTAIYERNQQQRREAVAALAEVAKTRGLERRFRHAAATIEALGGLRETPKFLLIKVVDVMRSRILAATAKLAEEERLDDARQAFDLTLDDLEDASLDLRARRRERLAPVERLAHAKQLPSVIDSRGLILRAPPKPLRPGELSGQPVSVGVARGPVKVLHAPDEKPLLAGDVLVARATDPGWTPLFVNAAAVVLEVGGVLQHGALVAREYGKPCVSGVENATVRLRDGQLIEVDGAAGTVRLIDE